MTARASVAVGIDVAARRGCDVVALGTDGIARPVGRVHTAVDLSALLDDLRPGAVAIDSPPAWAGGARRGCERELSARGVSVFTTPDAARGEGNPFYDWMRTGFAMFSGASGYATLETFPHACALVLHGGAPDRGLMGRPAAKQAWRRGALDAAAVDHTALRTIDEVDAALCAVTGRAYLEGRSVALGDPGEGVITLPGPLPERVRRPGTR